MSHDVDLLLAAARANGTVEVPDGWGQGRATFGGLVGGALVARALGALELPESTVRSVTINFVAPTNAGPATLDVEVLRQGRSATQAEVRLTQSDADEPASVRAIALVTFGTPRPSTVEIAPSSFTSTHDVEALDAVPYLAGLTPDFIGHVDLRVAEGGFPFTGSATGNLLGFMRFREPTSTFDLAHLVTLIDGWPPAPAQMLAQPAALSTMTWTLELLAPVAGGPESFWSYDVVTDAAHEGYAHTQARIADAAGTLIAISRQTVAVFG